tara:strand:+ start:264 stop:497 length:234 start_codon:yes stop_codon:yes gene_type:complete
MKIIAATPEHPLTTLEKIRNKRHYLLLDSDWTQNNDSPLSDDKKDEWKIYRQQLRDLPEKYTDEDNFSDVLWPTEPE